MKTARRFLLLFFFIFSSFADVQKDKTLSASYEEIEQFSKEESKISKILNKTDRNCVKQKIKFSTNALKSYPNFFGTFASLCGFYLCLEEKKALHESVLEMMLTAHNPRFIEKIDCFKNELKNVNLNSSIVKDFDPKSLKFSTEVCNKEIGDFRNETSIEELAKGFKIDEISCGIINEKYLKIYFYSAFILSFGQLNKEVLSIGKQELLEFDEKKSLEACNCVIEKI